MKKYLLIYVSIFIPAFALLLALSLAPPQGSSRERCDTEGIQAEAETEAEPVDSSSHASEAYALERGAAVIWRTEFSACGHLSERIDYGTLDGMTRAELEEVLPDCSIISFGRTSVELLRTDEGFCPLHPMLTIRNAALCVYRVSSATLEQELIARPEVDLKRFPPPERIRLKQGITFSSYDELEEYLEAYDS